MLSPESLGSRSNDFSLQPFSLEAATFQTVKHRLADVYVAVAQIESVVYKDAVGPKIFERGAKLFPEDANFMIEYLQFLHAKDDTTSEESQFQFSLSLSLSLSLPRRPR